MVNMVRLVDKAHNIDANMNNTIEMEKVRYAVKRFAIQPLAGKPIVSANI